MKQYIYGGLIALCLCVSIFAMPHTHATDTFNVIPESQQDPDKIGQDIDDVSGLGASGSKGSVRDRYNQKADEYAKSKKGPDTGSMFATGIFTRDGILDYVVYAIRFLSQIALIVGAGMIIWSGYKYASASFTGKDPGTGDIKNAVLGVLVVIFSYAIIKALSAAFL